MILRPGFLLIAVLTCVALFLPAQTARSAGTDTMSTTATSSTIRERVDVGGYKLYIRCVGTGEPTVVFDNAGFLDLWHDVQAQVAQYRRACSYDREGVGESDPGPDPLTTNRLVEDLHRLLLNGHIPGPYLLVGNVFGGTTAYVYAHRYPHQIVGEVLVDAIPGNLLSPATIIAVNGTDIRASRQEVHSSGSLAALPLVVISHRIGYVLPQRIEGQWNRDQRILAKLSSNSVYVVGEHSSYGVIPPEQPALLFVAISQVLLASRTPKHILEPCNVFYRSTGGRCMSSSAP